MDQNKNGGFYQFHIDNKNVPIFKNNDAGEQCLVSFLNLCFSKLPPAAKTRIIFTE